MSSRREGSRSRAFAQQHDVALDRNQPADAEQSWDVVRIRHGPAVGLDPVVDDLETRTVEALDLFQVLRQTTRDRDVRVREARDGTVAECEAAVLAELVEAVLRRHADRYAGQRPRQLAVHIGVHEVRVQDARLRARDVSRDTEECNGVDVRGEGNRVEWNPACAELAREVPRAGLLFVQHQEADVPAAFLQLREE